jgi:hypothetical protein
MKNTDHTKQVLPVFTPYEKIKICSNIFGTKFLIDISGFYPIIIGKDEIPLIWLYSKINDVVVTLVDRNIPCTPQIKVEIDTYRMDIRVFDMVKKIWIDMLKIDFSDKNQPCIDLIDLRPIGFNLFGDKDVLSISNHKFKEMKVIGGQSVFGVA